MPLYDYKCRACGHTFEALVRSSDTSAPACPSCQSQDLEQLLSMFAVSSEGTRGASLATARKDLVRSKRDEKIAEREHVLEHMREHHEPDR